MSRVASRIELTEPERMELERRERAHSGPYRDRQRAKMILLASEGLENQQIAQRLKMSRLAVGKWRERFSLERIAGLDDAPGRGRSSTLAPEQVQAVLSRVVQPPAHLRRWSCRTMARESGLSKSTVHKLWASNDLKPHLSRTFKLSSDPEFETKFWDIVGLYLNPPEQALVLCCDEKSQIQALSRSQPGLPLGTGHIQTRTHDYYRNGTVTLFAALDYLQGKIIARTDRRHTHREWLRFLKHIDEQTPPRVGLHLIVDNYSAHKHPKVKAWLARHRRFHLHFTPTSASWLNLVERFFRDLTQQAIVGGSFENVRVLIEAIDAYLAQHNLKAKRYVWRADGAEVLRKINKAWAVATDG
jgi:DDE superfamily endonuclease/Winged helix-turn helix